MMSAFSTSAINADSLNLISKLLGLESGQLQINDVTDRESKARDVDFSTAKIISSKEDELLFPVIIYTSSAGEINSEKYEDLRNQLRRPPSYESSDFRRSMGFLFEGDDEAYVFLDSLIIASNSPPVKGIYTPWEGRRFMGYSIVGTLKSKNIDFQIFIIEPSKEIAEKYPDYKNLFVKPPDLRKLGGEIYAVIKDAGLLDGEATTGERPPKSRGADGRNDPTGGSGARSDKRVDKHPARRENGGDGTPASGNLWLWIICASAITLPFLYFIIRKARR